MIQLYKSTYCSSLSLPRPQAPLRERKKEGSAGLKQSHNSTGTARAQQSHNSMGTALKKGATPGDEAEFIY